LERAGTLPATSIRYFFFFFWFLPVNPPALRIFAVRSQSFFAGLFFFLHRELFPGRSVLPLFLSSDPPSWCQSFNLRQIFLKLVHAFSLLSASFFKIPLFFTRYYHIENHIRIFPLHCPIAFAAVFYPERPNPLPPRTKVGGEATSRLFPSALIRQISLLLVPKLFLNGLDLSLFAPPCKRGPASPPDFCLELHFMYVKKTPFFPAQAGWLLPPLFFKKRAFLSPRLFPPPRLDPPKGIGFSPQDFFSPQPVVFWPSGVSPRFFFFTTVQFLFPFGS